MEPKNALLKQYQKFFQFDDVELVFTDDALEAVGQEALKRGTGARGLRAILEGVLLEVMYDLPSRTDVSRCVIDRAVVMEKVHPTLITSDEGERAAAPEVCNSPPGSRLGRARRCHRALAAGS